MEKNFRSIESDESIKKHDSSKSSFSSRNKTSSEISISNSKRGQVYSNYIERGHKELNTDDIKTKPNDYVKKPRLNLSNNDAVKAVVDYNSDLMSRFIGLNYFNCENIFIDLIDQELILINLDEKSKSGKSSFCFKGRCSISLIHGEIQINGYVLKHYFNQTNCKKDWYDVYSPETNSFVSLFNKAKLNSQSNIDTILNRIKIVSNLNIDSKLEESLKKFLDQNEFSVESSSLIAIKPLRSQISNYLSYFENFHNVYQSTSKLHSDIDKNHHNNFENKFLNVGIYPVSSDHFNAIHIISNEEKEFTESLANYKGK
jgi:hypothetical protein